MPGVLAPCDSPCEDAREWPAERFLATKGGEREEMVSSGSKSMSWSPMGVCGGEGREFGGGCGCPVVRDARKWMAGRSGFWRLRKGRGRFMVVIVVCGVEDKRERERD
jgi:hypothetical protein